jgi:VanZ family protein
LQQDTGIIINVVAAALVLYTGALELLQLMIPGRHARVIDFVVDAIGVCAGLVTGAFASRAHAFRE